MICWPKTAPEWTFDFNWRFGVNREISGKTTHSVNEGRWTMYNVNVKTTALPAEYLFKGTKHYNLEKIFDQESVEQRFSNASGNTTPRALYTHPNVFIADQSSEYDAPVPVFDREYFGSSAVYISLDELKYIGGETNKVRATLDLAKKNKSNVFADQSNGSWQKSDYVPHQGWDIEVGDKLFKVAGGQEYYEFYFSVICECKRK